ncbi:uncharacterized protein PV06_10889 [Exophiala oligosperma]|uniref:Heterokaryon incompatibility domain-containing protein n=1 Tax=Exophiala oligosperma TaxID=215243 RepID=A0A0D2A9J1_9EURO|nr:uncharacterized protein PV06_10889 [Exophiala oligosperma]KIW36991.1 hypothetical protein PV06_10889 [Exophiala oligosperma]
MKKGGPVSAVSDVQHFWVDACCVDEEDHTELAEAIASIFADIIMLESVMVYPASGRRVDDRSSNVLRPLAVRIRVSRVQDDLDRFSYPGGRPKELEQWDDERFFPTPPIQPTANDPLSNTIHQNNALAFQANQQAFSDNAQLSTSPESSVAVHHDAALLMSGLHIKTDVNALHRVNSVQSIESESRIRSSTSASSLPFRVPSIRAHLHSSAGSVSPGTTISSPQIAAMVDITPLPSPTTGTFEMLRPISRTRSRGSSMSSLRSFKLDMNPPAYPVASYNLGNLSPTSPRRRGYPASFRLRDRMTRMVGDL